MTNEEKIKKIAQRFRTARMFSKHPCEIAEDAAQQMAEWKDRQYAKVLATILIELDELKHQVKSLLP